MGITAEQHLKLKVGDKLHCDTSDGWGNVFKKGGIYPVLEVRKGNFAFDEPVVRVQSEDIPVNLCMFISDFSLVEAVRVPSDLVWSEYMEEGLTRDKLYTAVQLKDKLWKTQDDFGVPMVICVDPTGKSVCEHLEQQASWEIVK